MGKIWKQEKERSQGFIISRASVDGLGSLQLSPELTHVAVFCRSLEGPREPHSDVSQLVLAVTWGPLSLLCMAPYSPLG